MKIGVNIKKKDGKTVSISAAEKPAQKKTTKTVQQTEAISKLKHLVHSTSNTTHSTSLQ